MSQESSYEIVNENKFIDHSSCNLNRNPVPWDPRRLTPISSLKVVISCDFPFCLCYNRSQEHENSKKICQVHTTIGVDGLYLGFTLLGQKITTWTHDWRINAITSVQKNMPKICQI
jgi:hypothetical protein